MLKISIKHILNRHKIYNVYKINMFSTKKYPSIHFFQNVGYFFYITDPKVNPYILLFYFTLFISFITSRIVSSVALIPRSLTLPKFLIVSSTFSPTIPFID